MEEVLYDIRRVVSGVQLNKNTCELYIKDLFGGDDYSASKIFSGNRRANYEYDRSEEIEGVDLFEQYKNNYS